MLRALQRLAAGDAPEDLDEEADVAVSGTPLGVVGIKRGSAVFQFATPHPELALAHLRQTGAILASPEEIGDNGFGAPPGQRAERGCANAGVQHRAADARRCAAARIGVCFRSYARFASSGR